MGVSFTLKNLPPGLLEQVRTRAKRHHRSLQGEILALLETALEPSKLTVEDLHERVRMLGLTTPDQATDMLRTERDARESR